MYLILLYKVIVAFGFVTLFSRVVADRYVLTMCVWGGGVLVCRNLHCRAS